MLTIPKRSLILTLLLFGWGCHQSGDKLETSKSKAFDEVGGTSRELKPITASMVINCSKYYEGPKRCNSAVLGKKEGITTAHCLFYKDPETSQFATVPLDHYSIEPFGTGSLEACQTKINSTSPKDGTDLKFNFLEKFYIHPMFIEKYSLYHILSDKMQYAKNPTQHWRMHRQAYELRLEFTAYDVAVLIFEQEVPWQVAPSKIPGKNEKIIQDFVEVAGYNAFSKEVPYGQATLERIEARPPLSSGYRIIIGFDGQGTACNGDSGGPVGRLLQDNKTIGLYGLYEGGGQACGKSELKASPNFVHDLRGSQNWIACKFRKAGRPPLPSLAAANQQDPFCDLQLNEVPKAAVRKLLAEFETTDTLLKNPYTTLSCNESKLRESLRSGGGKAALTEWCNNHEKIAQYDAYCPKEPLDQCLSQLKSGQNGESCFWSFQNEKTCYSAY